MEPGYEAAPGPVGRQRRRRLPIVIGAVVVLLAVAIAKPWAGPDTQSTARVRPTFADPTASPRAPVANAPAAAGSVVADPSWPATTVASGPVDRAVAEAESALGSLTSRSGAWGVGATGAGPRLIREEPWEDWTPVAIEQVDGPPAHIAIWPGTDLCVGYPTIFDRPTVVAITAPAHIDPAASVVGWWTDGGRVASLTGSIRQIAPVGTAGIGYLERVDRAPWPAGRYEFHLETGGRTVALTVCLARGT
jgi:hypothetical protein